ncbi:MAG: CPBP family intramembrane glutamic endopeptidase [Candidatus Hodarchaeales archaeon]|jgi:membrane protease YdiL (CAAX protease family)
MLQPEIARNDEKNGRKGFSILLLPVLSFIIAMVLFYLLEAMLNLIISSNEISLQLDSTIKNLLSLLIAQLVGAIIVFFALIPLFKVKKVDFHPISFSSIHTTIEFFFLTLGTTFLSSLFFTSLFTAFNLDPQFGYSEITITTEHVSNPFNILLFLITMTIGAALFEEITCRRLLIPLLEDNGVSSFVAVILSSIMFTIAHLDADLIYGNIAGGFIHITGLLLLAMILGMTYITTRNVIFPIFIHAVSNLFGSLSILFMLMENDILLTIYSFLVLVMLVIGVGRTIYTAWIYFHGKQPKKFPTL